jgi:hypothetical protein
MFATGSGLRWRSLEKDDLDGVCALYPGTGTGGCDVLPCPAPLLCVANACQRRLDARDVCAPCARVADACEAAGDGARCVDVGRGATAGRVCGRACLGDAECGAGFRCVATTSSGDLQCVSDVACRNGASACDNDAQCTQSTCRDGACVGPAAADGGADAAASDANADAGVGGGAVLTPSGGGCACVSAPREGGATPRGAAALAWLGLAGLVLTLRRYAP